jgi:hypothetical protein
VEGELLSAEYKPDDVKEPLQLCEITPGRRLHAINSVILYYYYCYCYYYYIIVIDSFIKSARTLQAYAPSTAAKRSEESVHFHFRE